MKVIYRFLGEHEGGVGFSRFESDLFNLFKANCDLFAPQGWCSPGVKLGKPSTDVRQRSFARGYASCVDKSAIGETPRSRTMMHSGEEGGADMTPVHQWTSLNHLQVGRYAEYFF